VSDCSLELILITELDDDSVGRSEMEVLTSSSPGSVLISLTAEEVSLLLTLIWLTSAVHEDEHDDDDDDDDVSPCPGECLH